MKKTIRTLQFLLLIALIGGCRTNPSEPDPPNLIVGKVTLWGSVRDSSGHVIANAHDSLPDASGVRVEIDGTTYSTITDTQGKWQIENVPAGVYTYLFSKAGFDATSLSPTLLGTPGYYFFQYSGEGTYFIPRVDMFSTAHTVLHGAAGGGQH